MRNGGVKRFDCETRHFAAPVKMWRDDDDADWVGLYEQREMIIGCDKSGKVASWSRDAFDEAEQKNQVNFEKGESNVSFWIFFFTLQKLSVLHGQRGTGTGGHVWRDNRAKWDAGSMLGAKGQFTGGCRRRDTVASVRHGCWRKGLRF